MNMRLAAIVATFVSSALSAQSAAAIEPDRIVHRLNRGNVYADRGKKEKAREQYRRALRLKGTDFNDRHYQRRAETALNALR